MQRSLPITLDSASVYLEHDAIAGCLSRLVLPPRLFMYSVPIARRFFFKQVITLKVYKFQKKNSCRGDPKKRICRENHRIAEGPRAEKIDIYIYIYIYIMLNCLKLQSSSRFPFSISLQSFPRIIRFTDGVFATEDSTWPSGILKHLWYAYESVWSVRLQVCKPQPLDAWLIFDETIEIENYRNQSWMKLVTLGFSRFLSVFYGCRAGFWGCWVFF